MNLLLFVILIIQLLLIVFGFLKKNYKPFIVVICSAITFLILYIICLIKYDTLYGDGHAALNEFLGFSFRIFLIVIVEMMPLIISIFGKKYFVARNDFKTSRLISSIMIGILGTAIIVITGFIIIFNNTSNNINSFVIDSLNNKYGNNGFKIISLENNYSHYGFTSTYLVGYYVKVKDKNNIIFNSYIDIDFDYDPYIFNSLSDEYLLKLYGLKLLDIDQINILLNEEVERLNVYFKDKYNLTFSPDKVDDYNVNDIISEAIPNNYNKVPSYDEAKDLIRKYVLTHNIKIDIYSDNKAFSSYQKAAELVAKDIDNYYKNINEFEANINYHYQKYSKIGYIVIEKENIYINEGSQLINKDLSDCKKIPK